MKHIVGRMTPYIRAIRALTATVFQRVYRPVAWVIGGILCLLLVFTIWLSTTVSSWWWLLLILLIPLVIIVILVGIVLWILSQRLLPRRLERTERVSIERFADKVIMRIAEVRATPPPVLVFFIAKDVIRGKKSTYLEGIIEDSTSLKQDFLEIRNLFI